MKNQNIFDYALLADAAYSKFIKHDDFDQNIKNILNDEKDGENPQKITKPIGFSEYILGESKDKQNYEVVVQWADRGAEGESGFSAVIFKKHDEYVLAIRGTANNRDLYNDLRNTNIRDIVLDGLGYKQIVDLYNFWKQVNAPAGTSYQVAVIEDLATIPSLVDLKQKIISLEKEIADNLHYPSLLEEKSKEYNKLKEEFQVKFQEYDIAVIELNADKVITFKSSSEVYQDDRAYGLGKNIEKVTVTGHSLGGHLSAAFSRLFPQDTKHAYMFNGAGFGQ